MELLDWIPSNYLSHILIQFNPNAIDHIEKHHIPKHWYLLSKNPGALPYVYRDNEMIKHDYWLSNPNPAIVPFIEKCGYGQLSLAVDDLISNPNTLHLVNHRLVSTRLKHLAINTSPLAIELLEYYIDQLNDYEWSLVSSNPSALSLIKKHPDRINWFYLSSNPSAIHLLLQKPHLIVWGQFSKNTHPLAIEHIKKNLNRVLWSNLSRNPAAIDILKENKDRIDWYMISANPAIFEYNYPRMAKEKNDIIHEELMAMALHPDRVEKWLQQGYKLSAI